MDWIEKANKILENEGCEELEIFFNKYTDPITKEKFIKNYVIDAMIEFAKLACEQQKKLCAENATIDWEFDEYEEYPYIDKDSILDTPIVKFNNELD
jgi:hypothetical protein